MQFRHRDAAVRFFVGALALAPSYGQSPLFADLGDATCAINLPPRLYADFNGDGAVDLLTCGVGALGVVFDVAGPTGGPCTSATFYGTVGYSAPRTAAGDFDGDGDLDAFVTGTLGGTLNMPPTPPLTVHVLVNDGNGGFAPSVSGPVGPAGPFERAVGVASADFNADGYADVAAHFWRSGIGPDSLRIYLSNGSAFTLAQGFSAPIASPVTIATDQRDALRTGDFDGDGNMDVALLLDFPTPQRSDVAIGYGNGAGGFTFSSYSTVSVGHVAQFEAIHDLDLDGRDDLVFRGLSGFVNVVYGVPSPGIGFVNPYASGFPDVTGAAVSDVDGDGLPDLVANVFMSGGGPVVPVRGVVAMRGLGARAFGPGSIAVTPQYSSYGNQWTPVSATDRDGDGDDEIVMVPGVAAQFTVKRAESKSVYAPGCAGTGGVVPKISAGTASLGNSAFAIGLTDAAPFSLALLGLSTAPAAGGPCGVSVDLGSLLLPLPGPGATWTDANGAASIALPIPNLPFLSGVAVCAQWAVADPAGGLGPPGATFSATPARTVLIL